MFTQCPPHMSLVSVCVCTRLHASELGMGRWRRADKGAFFFSPHYLLNIVVQRDDPQRGGEVGAGRDGGAHRRGLAHVPLVGGELEIRGLIVLVQDLDNEVGVGRERVPVVLLRLKEQQGSESVSECTL